MNYHKITELSINYANKWLAVNSNKQIQILVFLKLNGLFTLFYSYYVDIIDLITPNGLSLHTI